jgi:hypothetical protein
MQMKMKLICKQTDLPLTEADCLEVFRSTQTLVISEEDESNLTIQPEPCLMSHE